MAYKRSGIRRNIFITAGTLLVGGGLTRDVAALLRSIGKTRHFFPKSVGSFPSMMSNKQLAVCMQKDLYRGSHGILLREQGSAAGWWIKYIERQNIRTIPNGMPVYIEAKTLGRLSEDEYVQLSGRIISTLHADFYLQPYRPQALNAFRKCGLHLAAVSGVNLRMVAALQEILQREVFYTPGGVDLRLFPPVRKGIVNPFVDVPKVGVVGMSAEHIRGRKGGMLIERACRLLGWGPKSYSPLSRAAFKYSHDKMSIYYSTLFAYVCASDSEGGPLPILEAMATGIPVVTTNVGLVPEVIVDGQNGFIVERTSEAIAQALRRLRDPEVWKAISINGVDTVAAKRSLAITSVYWDRFLLRGYGKGLADGVPGNAESRAEEPGPSGIGTGSGFEGNTEPGCSVEKHSSCSGEVVAS